MPYLRIRGDQAARTRKKMLGNFEKTPQYYLLKWVNIAFLVVCKEAQKVEVLKDEAAATVVISKIALAINL